MGRITLKDNDELVVSVRKKKLDTKSNIEYLKFSADYTFKVTAALVALGAFFVSIVRRSCLCNSFA